MVCRLVGAKPLSEPMLGVLLIGTYVTNFKWNLKWNLYIFIQENAFENAVWEMVTILSRPQCVNRTGPEFFGAK